MDFWLELQIGPKAGSTPVLLSAQLILVPFIFMEFRSHSSCVIKSWVLFGLPLSYQTPGFSPLHPHSCVLSRIHSISKELSYLLYFSLPLCSFTKAWLSLSVSSLGHNKEWMDLHLNLLKYRLIHRGLRSVVLKGRSRTSSSHLHHGIC